MREGQREGPEGEKDRGVRERGRKGGVSEGEERGRGRKRDEGGRDGMKDEGEKERREGGDELLYAQYGERDES